MTPAISASPSGAAAAACSSNWPRGVSRTAGLAGGEAEGGWNSGLLVVLFLLTYLLPHRLFYLFVAFLLCLNVNMAFGVCVFKQDVKKNNGIGPSPSEITP